MPGPPPKSNPARRNAPLANTMRLPSEGRKDPAPAWPFDTPEPRVWAELWSTPQAVAWDKLKWTRVVARYAHVLIEAESEMNASLLGEVRQLEDRLGLTPMAMLRLRWEIVEDELGAKRDDKQDDEKPKQQRTLVVVDDAVAGS